MIWYLTLQSMSKYLVFFFKSNGYDYGYDYDNNSIANYPINV